MNVEALIAKCEKIKGYQSVMELQTKYYRHRLSGIFYKVTKMVDKHHILFPQFGVCMFDISIGKWIPLKNYILRAKLRSVYCNDDSHLFIETTEDQVFLHVL